MVFRLTVGKKRPWTVEAIPTYGTVVAISVRTSKFRMGLFNDDRLAGQFNFGWIWAGMWNRHWLGQLKFRVELIWQTRTSAGGCKLTRSLSQLQARPPLLQAYCLCAFRALARSLIPAETLPPTCPNFSCSSFFEGTVYWNARSVQTRRGERESPG
jgi:hypothetical protein